jgi:hypothetical protein
MNTKENARWQAGAEGTCLNNAYVENNSTLTHEQRELLSKLRNLAELQEQHRATVGMMELDRLRLQSQLRATGWRASMPRGGGA